MPRVFTKTKNKGGRHVYRCSAPKCKMKTRDIQPGQEYLVWKFNWGERYYRHVECGMPKRSELSKSKMADLWDAIDDFQATKVPLSTVAEAARSVAHQYGEAAENIIMSFPAGNVTSVACSRTADALDSWAGRLDSWTPKKGDVQKLIDEMPEYQS